MDNNKDWLDEILDGFNLACEDYVGVDYDTVKKQTVQKILDHISKHFISKKLVERLPEFIEFQNNRDTSFDFMAEEVGKVERNYDEYIKKSYVTKEECEKRVLESLKREHQFYHRSLWMATAEESEYKMHKRWVEIEEQLKELSNE